MQRETGKLKLLIHITNEVIKEGNINNAPARYISRLNQQ